MRSERSTPPWLARRFVVCALSLGLFYAFVNPPLAVNDERHHLIRVYKLSLGQPRAIVDEGGSYYEAPAAFSSLVDSYASIQGNPKARVDLDRLLMDLSSREGLDEIDRFRTKLADQFPLVYLPQTPAVWLARALGLPSIWHLYLGRLATLAAATLLLGWSVSIAGRLSWVFAALGLMPMTLTEISGLSADAMIIALSFLFFALVAKHSSPEEPAPDARQRGAILGLLALLALCKASCVLYALALPAIRFRDADGRHARLYFAGIALLIGSGVAFTWSYANRSLLGPTLVSPALEQAHWMLAHPLDTLKAWARGVFREIDDYVIQFFVVRDILSRQMRFSTGVIATLYCELLLALTIGALYLPKEARAERRAGARWLAAASASYAFALFLLVHLTVNEVGAAYVHGMQGRFLLPVAPAIFGAIATLGHPIGTRWLLHEKGSRALAIIVCLNVLCLLALVGRYYVPFALTWPY